MRIHRKKFRPAAVAQHELEIADEAALDALDWLLFVADAAIEDEAARSNAEMLGEIEP